MNRLIHIRSYSAFCSLKLSADISNTTYTTGPTDIVEFGVPEVPYDSIVFVQEKMIIWTHGQIYDCGSSSDISVDYIPETETLIFN